MIRKLVIKAVAFVVMIPGAAAQYQHREKKKRMLGNLFNHLFRCFYHPLESITVLTLIAGISLSYVAIPEQESIISKPIFA